MIDFSEILFVIPARGGSKGLPGKNIKPLAGKPLIHYSIEYARLFTTDGHICLSTDSNEISNCASEIGLSIPFVRPDELASDTATTFSVLQHAINYFLEKNITYKWLVLLQPTSPFRVKNHLTEMLQLIDSQTDAIVSVGLVKQNPYFNLFEENENGFLKISKGDGQFSRRQDCPPVYAFDGSIYVFNTQTLLKATNFSEIANIKKYIIDEKYSVDIDTAADWEKAEVTIKTV